MDYISDSFGEPFSGILSSFHQCVNDWTLVSGSQNGVLSLSVFGTEGNRYSILVIEKENLRSDYTGRDGKWLLSETHDGEGHIRFDLEWAAEAAGSGCLVLCGRETPLRFSSPA
ncbi:MAG: hypothetical protein KAR44_11320 [Candidatus Aegiribacteria sp.]|nr:hypothetical protein [Candidatus Aegiribacteria sp.]